MAIIKVMMVMVVMMMMMISLMRTLVLAMMMTVRSGKGRRMFSPYKPQQT